MTTQTIIMDGKTVSQQILEDCASRVKSIVDRTGVTPCLATVLAGSDPASATYVKMKCKRCEAVGMTSLRIDMPESTTTEELVAKIAELSNDPAIHGILLQHPVPKQIDERAAFEAIVPSKDVDGVTIHSFGTTSFDLPGFGSCTPAGMMRLLDHYEVEIKGKHAVVIGRSPILGKPMAMMLLQKNATVTICHSRTRDLPGIVAQADILVGAVGKPQFIKAAWIKPGAVVIDAGYHPGGVGDVELSLLADKASAYTPVPGGVGPMTINTLIMQCVVSAERSLG